MDDVLVSALVRFETFLSTLADPFQVVTSISSACVGLRHGQGSKSTQEQYGVLGEHGCQTMAQRCKLVEKSHNVCCYIDAEKPSRARPQHVPRFLVSHI